MKSFLRCRPLAARTIVGIAVLAAFAPSLAAQSARGSFEERVYHDSAGDHKYTVFVPAAYTTEKKWPVILYLHGHSGRGTDPKLALVGGLAPQIDTRIATFPFIVVFPQCEDRSSRIMFGWQAETVDGQRALKILDAVEREMSVDTSREILTGWSMGGCGAWSLAAQSSSRWSAILVIAGSGDPTMAPLLTKVPIWAVHGTKDLAIPIDEARRMVTAVNAAGGRAHFTELPNVRHNIGHVVYSDDAAYAWLLSPKTEPQDRNIIAGAGRKATPAEMVDVNRPFIPAVEIPQAVYLHLDPQAIEALADAVPDLVPAAALAGGSGDIHQTKRIMMARFNVTVSDINYRGALERLTVTTRNDGWADISIGIRNMIMETGSTQVNGRILRASAGPMQIVVGHVRPVWLNLRVRPTIVDRKVRIELGDSQFEIPNDNFYVTAPQVDVRGLVIGRRRIASAVSNDMVSAAYGRKSEIESQVRGAAAGLVERLEQQLDGKLSEIRTISAWPMPAYQPRFRIWPDRMRIDRSGMSLVLGMTIDRPQPDTNTGPVKRIDRPPIDLAAMPAKSGLQFGISGAVLEGLSAVVIDSGVAKADTRDLGLPEFAALGDRARLVQLIPDLGRYGEKLQVRTNFEAIEPMVFAAPPRFEEYAVAAGRELELQIPHVRFTVDIKTNPGATAWRRCAEFDLRLIQRIHLSVDRTNFEKRVVHLDSQDGAQITVNGRFADGYFAVDQTLGTQRLGEMFHAAWRAAEDLEVVQGTRAQDLVIGPARLRVQELGWSEPFLMTRFGPARTRVTNSGAAPLVYSVRGPFTEWGGPYTLAPGKSHDFPVPYRLTLRTIAPAGDTQTLPMGTHFIFSPNLDARVPSNIATQPPRDSRL